MYFPFLFIVETSNQWGTDNRMNRRRNTTNLLILSFYFLGLVSKLSIRSNLMFTLCLFINIMHLQTTDIPRSVTRLALKKWTNSIYDFNAISVHFFGVSLIKLLVISAVCKCIIFVGKHANLKFRLKDNYDTKPKRTKIKEFHLYT